MWNTFTDFKEGRLQHFYYYNMAYEKPLYLHINLSKDGEHRPAFWYIASTIRHIGVGNYGALNEDQKASAREVLRIYKNYRDFFVHGSFDGPDPLTHIHALPGRGAVLLCFNDRNVKQTVNLSLDKNQLGCSHSIGRVDSLFGPSANVRVKTGKCLVTFTLRPYDVAVFRVCNKTGITRNSATNGQL